MVMNDFEYRETYIIGEYEMKKWIIVGVSIITLAALGTLGFVWAGTAFAQAPYPPSPDYPYGMMGGQYHGYGMMGGYGMWGTGSYGPMHEYMVAALADALNLTPDEVQARIEKGETPWQIAQAQGLSDDQIQQLMLDAHDKALDKAVEAGLLTQDQAEWMDGHMESMWSGDFNGFGGCHGGYDGDNSGSSAFNNPMMGRNRGPSY
jgi:hypothetical protein